MKVNVAEHAGTCFGVKKAIDIAFEAAERDKNSNTYILGELVHNPYVVEQLHSKGVKEIERLDELKQGDNLIIRAHGELKYVYDYCVENKINLIDASCPFVKKAQNIAYQLEKDKYQVILLGDKDHPEVRAIADRTDNAIIISNPDKIDESKIKKYKKIGILSQTTQKTENLYRLIINIIRCNDEVKIHNTICNATYNRQNAAVGLCSRSDVMVVIGGKNSANTQNLAELCSNHITTYLITGKDELQSIWFKGKETIGVTAGASTPAAIIEEVVKGIKSYSGLTANR